MTMMAWRALPVMLQKRASTVLLCLSHEMVPSTSTVTPSTLCYACSHKNDWISSCGEDLHVSLPIYRLLSTIAAMIIPIEPT